jgi:hypothetical protein
MTFIGTNVDYRDTRHRQIVCLVLFEARATSTHIRFSRLPEFFGDGGPGNLIDVNIGDIRDMSRRRVAASRLTRSVVAFSRTMADRYGLKGDVPTVMVDELFTGLETDAQARRVGARNGHQWCHMWCEPGDEQDLHFVAKHVGLQRAWFQPKHGFPHYDLTPSKRLNAIDAGVRVIALRTWLQQRRAAEQTAEAES